jgi:hypothetical protein
MVSVNQAVIVDADLRAHFHDQVDSALSKQALVVEHATNIYLVNLLMLFVDARELFDDSEDGRHLKPLAFHYADAVNAENVSEKSVALKKLGDVALFVAGLFAGSLNRKLVDVDYYIAMGGSAYGCLDDISRSRCRRSDHHGLFAELAENFAKLVDVLGEVGDSCNLNSNTDVLRLCEIWLKTGSKRAYKKLLRHGLSPTQHSPCITTH